MHIASTKRVCAFQKSKYDFQPLLIEKIGIEKREEEKRKAHKYDNIGILWCFTADKYSKAFFS